MRAKKYLQAIGAAYLNQVVILLGGLWLTKFLLEQLGQEQLGLWLIVLQLMAMMELMDLGVLGLSAREVAYHTGQDGVEESRSGVRKFLRTARRITYWQVPVILAGGWGAGGSFLGWRLEDPVVPVLASMVAVFALLFPFKIYQFTLQGLQDHAFVGFVSGFGWLVQAGVTVILVLAGFGMWALLIAWGLNLGLCVVACRLRLAGKHAWVFQHEPAEPEGKQTGSLLKRGAWVSIIRVSAVLQSGIETILLGVFLGPAAVVIYVCTTKLVQVSRNQLLLLTAAAEPGLSQLRTASPERISRISTSLAQLNLFFAGLAVTVILAVNEPFVKWWVGDNRFGGGAFTILICVALLARVIGFILAHLLYCMGFEKPLAFTTFAGGLVTVAVVTFTAPSAGLYSAPLGSLIGVCLVTVPIECWLLVKFTQINVRSLLGSLALWVSAIALLGTGSWTIARVCGLEGLLGATIAGLVATVAYCGLLTPILTRSAIWDYLGPRWAALRQRILRPSILGGSNERIHEGGG